MRCERIWSSRKRVQEKSNTPVPEHAARSDDHLPARGRLHLPRTGRWSQADGAGLGARHGRRDRPAPRRKQMSLRRSREDFFLRQGRFFPPTRLGARDRVPAPRLRGELLQLHWQRQTRWAVLSCVRPSKAVEQPANTGLTDGLAGGRHGPLEHSGCHYLHGSSSGVGGSR